MDVFFSRLDTTSLSVEIFLICAGVSLVLGALIALTYTRRAQYTQSFVLTLVLLPVTVQTVIMLVNGNVGTGVAVAGAFSLVRFRSVPGNAKDIAVIFLAMVVGLTCGIGHLGIAVLFACIACAVLYLLVLFRVGVDRSGERELQIVIPESLDYTEVFDEVLGQYAARWALLEVKTASLGSLYKLRYSVHLKRAAEEKSLIDALRCRNGNLEVRCGRPISTYEQL